MAPYGDPVAKETFIAIQNIDIDSLSELSELLVRPILPCLVRMSLCAPIDQSERWSSERKKILKCLSGIEAVNGLVGLLSIDFDALEQDAKKQQQLRSKAGSIQSESVFNAQYAQGIALEFEKSDAANKLRLLLSEILYVAAQIKEARSDFYMKSSELFENDVYLWEVSDVLCIAQAELPNLLPVSEVVETLLHIPNGIWLICRVVANVPDSFNEVCKHLVSNGEEFDMDSRGGQRRGEALKALCRMNPCGVNDVIALCMLHCKMPSLMLRLKLDECETSSKYSAMDDISSFISGLILSSNPTKKNWFSQFIKNSQKGKQDPQNSMLRSLREQLLTQLRMLLPLQDAPISDDAAVRGCVFIKIYCALKVHGNIRFNEEELMAIVQLITCETCKSNTGVRFICLSLSMVLSCPHLMSSIDQEKQIIDWIRFLVKEAPSYEKVPGINGSFGEMLLLIAIHFHSNQNHAIAELVGSTLGMKSSIKANTLTRLKIIFTQEIFTEQVVASHAVRVPVTKDLNANMTGFLPIHCIYQLIKSRAFSKHKVPIKAWIYKQIQHSTTPLHPLLPPLIEVFINSIILPCNKTERSNEPISEEEIQIMFRNSVLVDSNAMETSLDEQGGNMTSQLLLMYYVLLYEEVRQANSKNQVSSKRKIHEYSAHLLAQLPLKYLLLQAQKDQQQYVGLFSPMLRLLATQFPQLCLVEDWLIEEVTTSRPVSVLPGKQCSPEQLDTALSSLQDHPIQSLMFLEQIAETSSVNLVPFADTIITNLPHVLEKHVPRRLTDIVKKIWFKLNSVMPRKLRLMTVNSLQVKQKEVMKVAKYTEDDLTKDPLTVLRCDPRVFRCPPVLEICLRILEAFLQASRSFYTSQNVACLAASKNITPSTVVEKEEVKNALIAAQESATIQLLLESCLPTKEEKDQKCLLSNLREVQCIACCFMHQQFIADPNLAKLVHFQGYPSELLPLTTAGIPSMHICLDFIPELLSQPNMEKQVFAVELVSYLSEQYPLPKSLAIAKLAISVMITLLGVLPANVRVDFFTPVLPALVRMCKSFPPLNDDAVHFLTQLGRVCATELTIATNDLLPDSTNFPASPLPKQNFQTHRTYLASGNHRELLNKIHETFTQIVRNCTVVKHLEPISS